MKIAYVTGDIQPNGNFSLFHDLLANYPVPHPNWRHRVYIVNPNWDRSLVNCLKARSIDVKGCFEDFHDNTDQYWEKIRKDTEDVDVIISGNITNLDEILPDTIKKPIVSVSLAESGYKTSNGNYGSFYKPRFVKAAVSKTAIAAFPEHVRSEVTAIHSGIDPARLSQRIQREKIRSHWFPNKYDSVKLIMFTGVYQDSKGLKQAIDCLNYLPENYYLMVVTPPKDLNVPPHLHNRVHLCAPTYQVADIFLACDYFVLPTEHEGFSMALLEAWFLQVPVITTRHNSLLELKAKHPSVDFGQLVDVKSSSKDLAEAIKIAEPSSSAAECVLEHYMASNMISRWQDFLEGIVQCQTE